MLRPVGSACFGTVPASGYPGAHNAQYLQLAGTLALPDQTMHNYGDSESHAQREYLQMYRLWTNYTNCY